MSHHFYIQNASRRSAQAFPISLGPGAKFSEAKESFAEMLGVGPEQIIRLTTADGHIVLPGQTVPDEPLILEVERRAFDRLTGAGTFAPMEQVWQPKTIASIVFPSLVVFFLFVGFAIILGGLASASQQCSSNDISAYMFANLFYWGASIAQAGGISLKFICGLGLSLFWFIIFLEFLICIVPGIILLFWAGSFSADTKGSWAYIITCTLNITTAVLCFLAFTVVPGAYYAQAIDNIYIGSEAVGVPARYVSAVQVMAAGVIILLVANFSWIYSQACGKMIPEDFTCCDMGCGGGPKTQEQPQTGIVPAYSPTSPPTVTAAV